MGIPFYYKHIITKYKKIVVEKTPPCDALYIDFNSVIHQCAGKVTKEHAHTYNHKMIIDNIVETTHKMIDKAKPSKFVYIGIDGVAPRAKMVQQRKRRYISAFRKEALTEIYERHMIPLESDWDSNIITPGTDFMEYLSLELKSAFGNVYNNTCEIFISDSNEKGEGEQKLFDHMKQYTSNMNVIINGLDADLIMLSLLSDKSIYLQRDEHTFVDMTYFRKCITYHISQQEENIRYLHDYVFLCFLLGNDFLPGIPYLKIRDGAIDILISIYRECHTLHGEYIVTNDNRGKFTVNLQMLTNIIQKLSESESENMKYAINHYVSTAHTKNTSQINEIYPKIIKKYMIELEHYPLVHKHPLLSKNNTPDNMWNAKYYKYLFGSLGSLDVNQTTRYCEKYIDGLLWTVNYYFNREYDEHWYYKYNVTPLCVDIYKTLFAFDASSLTKRINELQLNSLNIDVSPQLQLLSVLPIQSLNCVPAHLRKVMTEIQYGCLHYYPIEFTICTFMKKFLWECTPILPDIDMYHMYQTYVKALKDYEKSM